MQKTTSLAFGAFLVFTLGAVAATDPVGETSREAAPSPSSMISVESSLGADVVATDEVCVLAGSDGRDRLVENFGLWKRGTFPLMGSCRFESGRTLCYYDEYQPGPSGTANSIPCTHSPNGIQRCVTVEEAFPSGSQIFRKVLTPAFSKPLDTPVPGVPRCLL